MSDFLERIVVPHMVLEEQVCFPYLEMHIPKLGGPIHVLTMEHQDFQNKHKALKATLQSGNPDPELLRQEQLKPLEETGTYLVMLLRNHIRQEQELLFKAADELLTPEEKTALLTAISHCEPMKDIRRKS
ncbi:MAG: hemerythrin domain-containing protein [Elusimicrobia bacterium]|nr:hemerythrin domain-containing protein [Elusimicrobiota bacterium]